MDWEKFREEGHKVIDFIADYYKSLSAREFPALSSVKPGFLQAAMPEPDAPQQPCGSFDHVMDDVKKHIVPGMTHWQHPDFYAFFPAQLSPAALLGDTIASAMNQPGFNWVASPAATELEVIVMDWLSRAFGLPEAMTWGSTGGGVLQPSATEAAVVAVLAAKGKSLERFTNTEEKQQASTKLVCYISDQAHFCVEKACRIHYIPHVRRIKTTGTPGGNYPMTGAAVREAVEADVAAGLIPCFLSYNYGTTGVCATDDFDDIAEVCKQHNIWINLDTAYAGATAICPEMREPLLPAFRHADSLFINGSKWFCLMTNASFFFFREKKYIVASLNATGVYLSNKYTDQKTVVDFKDYHLGMGRPFRALKVFSTLKYMGVEGIQSVIRRHCILAKYLDQLLHAHSDVLEFPVDQKFGFVSYRIKGDDTSEKTNRLLKVMEEERRVFAVGHVLEGKALVRVVLAYPGLEESDMENLAEYLVTKAKEIASA